MNDDSTQDQTVLFPPGAGDRLREAREAQGLTLADIANRTRVPTRHLEAIEAGRFDAMPSPTYAIGFARAYARVVGLDEREIANSVRQSPQLPLAHVNDYEAYEPSDPKRLPSRGLAIGAALIALAVLIGVALYYGTGLFRGSSDEPTLAVPQEAQPVAAPTALPAPAAGGQVSLVATDRVWLRVYDASGKTLVERELAAGDRYDVPGDANNPMINIGKPDKVQITVNGSAVPPLGDGSRPLKDVPISAAALLARGSGAAPAASPTAASPTRPRAERRRDRPAADAAPATPTETPPPAAAPSTTP